MNSSTKTYQEVSKKMPTHKKEIFIKTMIQYYKQRYNDYKQFKKDIEETEEMPTDESKKNKKSSIDLSILHIKLYQHLTFLFNSMIKKDEINIKNNFKNLSSTQMELMEFYEEICEGDYDLYDTTHNITIKTAENYRLKCIEIKDEYDLCKYVIEDYNKIKL